MVSGTSNQGSVGLSAYWLIWGITLGNSSLVLKVPSGTCVGLGLAKDQRQVSMPGVVEER